MWRRRVLARGRPRLLEAVCLRARRTILWPARCGCPLARHRCGDHRERGQHCRGRRRGRRHIQRDAGPCTHGQCGGDHCAKLAAYNFPTVLTFTAANYATAQTVTVGAVDDSIREGSHSGTLAHTVASADATFNNISVANVVVTITDNEPAAAIRAPADFDGDGKTDVAIFQRETGQWIGRYSATDLLFHRRGVWRRVRTCR